MERQSNGSVTHQPNLYGNLCPILQAIHCHAINRIICNHANCPELFQIFEHIKNCDKANECDYPKCIQTANTMKHYYNCAWTDCVCFKFGVKSEENQLYCQVKSILLRNQFLIWKRKIVPFRYQLLGKISDILACHTNQSMRDLIYQHLVDFDDQNFHKIKGISPYLTNLAQKSVHLLQKIQMNQQMANRDVNGQQQIINKTHYADNVRQIYDFLKKYSTDVLHDRAKLPPLLTKTDDVKQEIKVEIKQEEQSESPTNSSSLTPPKSISSIKSSPEPPKPPEWSITDLKKRFGRLHERLCLEKDVEVFLQPVDHVQLEIPDYPLIVTHPMDLSTIAAKLAGNEYTDPWAIINDYWLMFNNAWLYNKKSSRVYKICSNVARAFEHLADETMQKLGLCCGRDHVFLPQVLICCTPNMCVVNRDSVYHAIDNTDEAGRPVPELSSDKYVCCDKCFMDCPTSDSVQLMVSESTSTLVSVQKSLFTKLKNNVKEKEEFVHCKVCRKNWHKVCAEHIDEIWASGFYCPQCESHRPFPKQPNVLTSSNLPHCHLSRHIESRIDSWRQSQSNLIEKINVRVLSISNKYAEIKPEMRRIFVDNGEMPESLPYRLKAIFAFQQQEDGSEICLFGMHCQEYGSDCPEPNARRIYLSYLDSVNFFKPHHLRTDFYHRLLIAYLEYCRQLGFIHAHIWACPPGEGDDYIFHMHPPSQKLPKPKRLQDWYIAMLDKAVNEGVVLEYSDIFTYAFKSQLMSVSEMPYFEGDYWPTIIEDLLKEDLSNNGDCNVPASIEDEVVTTEPSDTNSKKRKLKRISNGGNNAIASKRRRQSDLVDGCNELMRRLFDLMEKRKENFFVIRLHSQSDASNLPDINDEDATGGAFDYSDLMDGRDKFLSLSRDKHLEFSSERRAKFATLVLCYELHLELRHGIIYSCNACDLLLLDNERYICSVCDEFELCERCAQRDNSHEHKLHRAIGGTVATMIDVADNVGDGQQPLAVTTTQNGSSLPPNGMSQQKNIANMTVEEKHLFVLRMMIHASRCRDANCRQNTCHQFKQRLSHFGQCTQRTECRTCHLLLAQVKKHAASCRNTMCPVPMCSNVSRLSNQSGGQGRLRQIVAQRQRMESQAVAAASGNSNNGTVVGGVLMTSHNGLHPSVANVTHSNEQRYKADIYAVHSYIDRLKMAQLAEPEFNRSFNQFLNENPRLRESWQRFVRTQQQAVVVATGPPYQQPIMQHNGMANPGIQTSQFVTNNTSQHHQQLYQPNQFSYQTHQQQQLYRSAQPTTANQRYIVHTGPSNNRQSGHQIFSTNPPQPPATGQFFQSHSPAINNLQFHNGGFNTS